jgi:uncharacterized protein YuzE
MNTESPSRSGVVTRLCSFCENKPATEGKYCTACAKLADDALDEIAGWPRRVREDAGEAPRERNAAMSEQIVFGTCPAMRHSRAIVLRRVLRPLHLGHQQTQIKALQQTREPFPKLEIDRDLDTVYIAFRNEKDGDLAKNVRRRVDACIDVDAAGRVIGVELFDMPMPEEQFQPIEGDL